MYRPRLPPRRHQVEALRRLRGKSAFALLMDMGTGKTKVVLDEFGARASGGDEIQDLLVIAPAGCYRNWFEDRGDGEPSEMRKHLDPVFFRELSWAAYSAGMGVQRRRRLQAVLEHDGPRALFMNVEAFSRGDKAVTIARRFLERGRCMMVIDESTKIKSRGATRTTEILELGRLARVRRIMTGLVTPRSPLDLYSQFEFLDWKILGHRSFWGFKARYAVMQTMQVGGWQHPRNVRVVVGYRDVDELQRKIAPHSYRVLSEECLDLPPQQWAFRDVELTPEQQRMYYEMREFATAQFSEHAHVTATMVLTQRMRLDQILCGIVVDESGEEHEIRELRTAALMELLDECEGKAVIWTSHDRCVRRVADAIARRYGRDDTDNVDRSVVAQFWGGNAATRARDEARFKTDPRCRFMVSTPMAGGMGNTWTVASLNIYFNNTDNLEHRSQSERRVYRDGQTQPVLHVDLRAPGTIDERKIKNLRNKIDLAAIVAGEDPREWLV